MVTKGGKRSRGERFGGNRDSFFLSAKKRCVSLELYILGVFALSGDFSLCVLLVFVEFFHT